MLLLYYTHSILFYLGLPTFQTNNDFKKHLHSIDYDYLPQEVCVAKCLQPISELLPTTEIAPYENFNYNTTNQPLKICLDNCISATNAINQTEGHGISPPKQIHENYSLNLICRDDNILNFKVNLHGTIQTAELNTNQSDLKVLTNSTPPTSLESNSTDFRQQDYATLFVIKIHLANNADKIFVYLSDDMFFSIDQLLANTTYNISVLAVHASNKYSVISQQQQFKTLRRSYTPGNVTEIKITHFTEDKQNKMYLSASLTWKPAADMTCQYNIICFSPESQDYGVEPLEIQNPRQLYKLQLENLTFSSVYKVGIRATNTKNMRESELFWKTFTVPSCVEWHNYNFNICAPEAPQNLYIEQIFIDQHKYSLNISWNLPSHLPDNYTLQVQDLAKEGEITTYNISKHLHTYFIEEISIFGIFYEVSLTSSTRGGHSTTTFADITKTVIHLPEKNPFVKLIAVILSPIFCVVILSLTIFIIYHRRAKLKRYQRRCKYFEELEKKAPIDPKNTLDFATNLQPNCNDLSYHIEGREHMLYNDDMEIDCKDLILCQVLGEGAFGLVKLGLYTDSKWGTTEQVAVKMLKDHPSAEDIYAFRREIEVMKSVEKHPNIVGIIGHCTRFSNQMMLITEYCSFGNLLNFLRDEWHFLHKFQANEQHNHNIISNNELNQKENSNQEINTVSSLPKSETENDKNNIQRDSVEIVDDNDVNVLTSRYNEGNNVIQHFKVKYNDIKVITTTPFDVTNHNKTKTNKDILKTPPSSTLQRVINLRTETILSTKNPNLATHNTCTLTSVPSISSAAAENKSYGYHGFCTNSCKCNVDVIIKNIDSEETKKQTEGLERALNGQQHQLSAQQLKQNVNKTCTETTIQIKNCECKIKEKFAKNQCNGAVENKSYFKLCTLDNKYFSRLNLKRAPTTKMKHKTKHGPVSHATKNQNCEDENDDDDLDENTSQIQRVPLTCGDLLNIARQVAVGMEFLAKNKVVHRDLAARNVLVAPDRTIKIADFGLSRDVYQENMYKKTGNGKLPIKWLALESMTHQVYTTQSDVWSYGILLYEIVTLGATPYPSISTNRLLHLLKNGYRMEKPKGCSRELYDLMHACWNAEPIARPTFNSIIQKLDVMMNLIDNEKDLPTALNSEVDKFFCKKQPSTQNVSHDDAYLKPL